MSFYLREQQHRCAALLFAMPLLWKCWLFPRTRAMCVSSGAGNTAFAANGAPDA
jgi:hypothetical protein